MARRSDHTREELKEMAITAGQELIRAEGFGAFSARRVASMIGYTVGTLYNVFGSYDELVLHINARTLDDWFAAMRRELAASGKGEPVLALSAFYICYSATHRHEWIALFEHHMDKDAPVPEWYAPKFMRFFEELEGVLLPYTGNNRRKARRAAHILWAGIHGIAILSLSGKLAMVGAESPELLAKSFVEHYVAGLAGEGVS